MNDERYFKILALEEMLAREIERLVNIVESHNEALKYLLARDKYESKGIFKEVDQDINKFFMEWIGDGKASE